MEKQPKIVLIEDDPDTVEAMKLVLVGQSYQVDVAPDPETGYTKIVETRPDLIILDVMFGRPEKTVGFDYAVKIRQNKDIASIPILMITSVNTRYPGFKFSDKTDGEYLPVDDFVDKPVEPDDLTARVEQLLSLKVSKWQDWPREGT